VVAGSAWLILLVKAHAGSLSATAALLLSRESGQVDRCRGHRRSGESLSPVRVASFFGRGRLATTRKQRLQGRRARPARRHAEAIGRDVGGGGEGRRLRQHK
jgi:hypothetical protein